jgi:hypothetical protein
MSVQDEFTRNESVRTAQLALKTIIRISSAMMALFTLLCFLDPEWWQFYGGGITTAAAVAAASAFLIIDLENYKDRRGRWHNR